MTTREKILKIIEADKLLHEAMEPYADDEILLAYDRSGGWYWVYEGILDIAKEFNKVIEPRSSSDGNYNAVVIEGVTFCEREEDSRHETA